MAKQPIPEGFIRRMKNNLGDEFEEFFEAIQKDPVISLRVNPLKDKGQFDDQESVPWCNSGRYLDQRPEFVFDPLIHAGAYYVQEASSMLFSQAIDFEKEKKILDLCASPGGKSTLILSFLKEDGILFTNELVRKRAAILYENLVKWGDAKTVISTARISDYRVFQNYFDVVLVDAPCSGEGMFRKNRNALTEWNESKPFKCSIEQRNILDEAVHLVSPGGKLIYSTCTYSKEENEQIAQWLYNKFGQIFEPQTIRVDPAWGVKVEELVHENGQSQSIYKCHPHRFRGEGLFISVFRKKENEGLIKPFPTITKKLKPLSQTELSEVTKFCLQATNYVFRKNDNKIYLLPGKYERVINLAFETVHVLKAGVLVGTLNFKTGELIPSHELAMSNFISPQIKQYDLNREEAIRYLRKENININEVKAGWAIVNYQSIALGWIKGLDKRINNFYPKDWKIRKSPG